MNQSIHSTPLTPDARPVVDSTFSPTRELPTGRMGSGTMGYRTSVWANQNRHWKGWPVVVIGLIVGAGVLGANYVTDKKAEERQAALAMAPAPALSEPGPAPSSEPAAAPDASTQAATEPSPAAKAAAKSLTPEQTLTREPTAAGPSVAPTRRERVQSKAPLHESVAIAPRPQEPAPAEPVVSVPMPAPMPVAPMPAMPEVQPTPTPVPAEPQAEQPQPSPAPAQ